MGHVAAIWRHPIKSHGRERLGSVALVEGQAMPWDRHWAVLNDASGHDPASGTWAHCRNYMIGARTPSLAGIWARLDEARGEIALRHADLDEIKIRLGTTEGDRAFLDWVAPLCPTDRVQPKAISVLPKRGHTDTAFPSISLVNLSSHQAVADRLGRPDLEPERWRCNFWLEGMAPWEESDWVGHRLRIGTCEVEVVERIVRCQHPAANPANGIRDADMLGALEGGWGHNDFGVCARVIQGGQIEDGDPVVVLR